MDPVVITWNFTNWVTVVLMALLGFMLVGLVASFIQKQKEKA